MARERGRNGCGKSRQKAKEREVLRSQDWAPGDGRDGRQVWKEFLESKLDTLDNGGEAKRGCGAGKTYPPGWPKAFFIPNSGLQKQRRCHNQQATKSDPFLGLITCCCFAIEILIGFQQATVFTAKTE